MPEFDKYAPYVWTCYGIAIVVLVGLVAWTAYRAREAKRRLDVVQADRKQGSAIQ